MTYKDFVENKKVVTNKITVKDSKDIRSGLLNVIKGLAKVGLAVIKIGIKIVGKVVTVFFWVLNEGVTFIAHKLQIRFLKLDSHKQDEAVKKMVATALITAVGVGVTFVGLSNKIKTLKMIT